MVAFGEVGNDGGSKGLVGGVTKSDGALAEFVGLEGVDAVADERVVEEMLDESRVLSGAHVAVDLVRHGDACSRYKSKGCQEVVTRFEMRSN